MNIFSIFCIVLVTMALSNVIDCKPIYLSSVPASSSKPVHTSQILSTCRPGTFVKRDCKTYLECYKGRWKRNFCAENRFWNQQAKKCDEIHNVPECLELAVQINSKAPLPIFSTKTSSSTSGSSRISSSSSTSSKPVKILTKPPLQRMKISSTSAPSTTTPSPPPPPPSSSSSDSDHTINSDDDSIYKPQIPCGSSGDDDYDDYEDEKEKKRCQDEREKLSKQSKDMAQERNTDNEITSASETSSKIEENRKTSDEDEEKMYDVFEVKSHMPRKPEVFPYYSNPVTKGKTCIIKGKEMICQESSEAPPEQKNEDKINSGLTSTTPTTTTTTIKPETISNENQCKESSTRHYSLQLDIKIDEPIEKLIKLVQVISYYTNLTIFSLKSAK